jgi:hypothetical protein
VRPFSARLPADSAGLSALRKLVREWLESLEIVEPDVAAIVAACSEIAGCAVESGPVEVTGVMADADVVIRCAGPPGWSIERDPARYVAALLVDDVSIEPTAERVSVVLRKAVGRGLRS